MVLALMMPTVGNAVGTGEELDLRLYSPLDQKCLGGLAAHREGCVRRGGGSGSEEEGYSAIIEIDLHATTTDEALAKSTVGQLPSLQRVTLVRFVMDLSELDGGCGSEKPREAHQRELRFEQRANRLAPCAVGGDHSGPLALGYFLVTPTFVLWMRIVISQKNSLPFSCQFIRKGGRLPLSPAACYSMAVQLQFWSQYRAVSPHRHAIQSSRHPSPATPSSNYLSFSIPSSPTYPKQDVQRYLTSSQLSCSSFDAVALLPDSQRPIILKRIPTVFCRTPFTTIADYPAAADQSAHRPSKKPPLLTTSHKAPTSSSSTERQTTHMARSFLQIAVSVVWTRGSTRILDTKI
ncbi:uncharacterized protein LACBIDRAFT_323902 [Laccaria bicolor S238N-H82]|uniref:Predicted protein n=1 Tax=Laccaria bicolor (strain S238N-H82 / ATCC MYA-4686) TaxID=486041 RepID=B0D004_LACBS|nr:uncharacterized protein LACBIDRAFT_323902 [Laccaria bicolor S238N-H82]EDR11373.1 predicted protein [Laccaria bicolor S238N-H82]|eukprot:XP_001877270.1 predicted protein [Laccaria bicolor S238N-H82]